MTIEYKIVTLETITDAPGRLLKCFAETGIEFFNLTAAENWIEYKGEKKIDYTIIKVFKRF